MRQSLRDVGLDGAFGCPDGGGLFPAVLALGGSKGGVPRQYLDLLVPAGFACLALAYFGTRETPPSLNEIPLEYVERGLRWLIAQPKAAAQGGRVAVLGGSKGGELALLAAATFPDLIGPVAAYTPSSVVWEGIDFGEPRPPKRSSWTYRGRPLAFVPYPAGVTAERSSGGWSGRPIYDRGLDNAEAVRQASIPIERATGPLLLLSGGDDRMWPAARMCGMAVQRMQQHGRAEAIRHLHYPDAGHVLTPPLPPSGNVAQQTVPFDLGGSPEASLAAHADAWPHVVRHLRGR